MGSVESAVTHGAVVVAVALVKLLWTIFPIALGFEARRAFRRVVYWLYGSELESDLSLGVNGSLLLAYAFVAFWYVYDAWPS